MRVQLTNVRAIHKAVLENINGRNNGVYGVDENGVVHRTNRARTVKGQLQVYSLVKGKWIVPASVYQA